MHSQTAIKAYQTKSHFGKWRDRLGLDHLSTVRGNSKYKIRGNKVMRILLVDDSVQFLDRLKAILVSLEGIEIIGSANDLPEALQTIRTTHPDVVLLDLQLPSGSGMKVLQMVKNEKLDVNVVVLTNYAFPQYRKKCVEAGAYAFLDKSTDFSKVPQVISALADLQEKGRGRFPPDNLTSPSEPKVRVS